MHATTGSTAVTPVRGHYSAHSLLFLGYLILYIGLQGVDACLEGQNEFYRVYLHLLHKNYTNNWKIEGTYLIWHFVSNAVREAAAELVQCMASMTEERGGGEQKRGWRRRQQLPDWYLYR